MINLVRLEFSDTALSFIYSMYYRHLSKFDEYDLYYHDPCFFINSLRDPNCIFGAFFVDKVPVGLVFAIPDNAGAYFGHWYFCNEQLDKKFFKPIVNMCLEYMWEHTNADYIYGRSHKNNKATRFMSVLAGFKRLYAIDNQVVHYIRRPENGKFSKTCEDIKG